MTWSALIVTVLFVALLCTGHFCVGLYWGLRLTESRAAATPDTAPVASYLETMLLLLDRSQELHIALSEQVQSLPERVLVAAAKLVKAVEVARHELRLKGDLQRLDDSHCPRIENAPGRDAALAYVDKGLQPKPLEVRAAEPDSGQLSRDDLSDLIARNEVDSLPSRVSDRFIRRPYPCRQYIAFRHGEQWPTDDDFEEVLCNDISVGGLSFFFDRPADADALVVSLGAPSALSFMLVKVVHCRSAVANGQVCYRIGCQFVRRLSGMYRWNEGLQKVVSERAREPEEISP